MLCLVLIRVSSAGILYRTASTVWSLWVSCMFRKGGWSDSTEGPLVRFDTRILERLVIGHACLMDVNEYVICCDGA